MKKERDRSIDMLKTLLVIGMILGHCIQLIGNPISITTAISTGVNLITFSGFLFCFGYAVSIAYLGKSKDYVKNKIIKNCFELLIAYYISGISYELFVTKELSLIKLIRILILSDIPGYSEFLVAFFVLNLLTLIFFNQIVKILNSKKLIIIIIIISLVSTFIPYKYILINQLGLILGSTKFACFPILQYSSYYILGMYFQRNCIKFDKKYLILSVGCTSLFIVYGIINKGFPSRFPPSIFWVLGGLGILYIYYIFSEVISNKISKNNKLYFIGENTLYFLLISNIFLFILKGYFSLKIDFFYNILVAILIILLCYISIYVKKYFHIIKVKLFDL